MSLSEQTKNAGTTVAIAFSLVVTWFAFDWNWLDFITYAVVLYLLAGFVYLMTHNGEETQEPPAQPGNPAQ